MSTAFVLLLVLLLRNWPYTWIILLVWVILALLFNLPPAETKL